MARPLISLLLGVASLAGCATYAPAPIAPADMLHSYQTLTLDKASAANTMKRIAPSATWSGDAWDRLGLLAAALNANPTIAEARAHVRSLDAAAVAAEVGPPMTLTLTAEYAGKATESSPWLFGATSDIPLDLGARKDARIDSAWFAAISGRYDYAEAVWATRMGISRSLADVKLTEREISIGQELAAVRSRQLAALERRVAGGEASRSDLERVRVDAAADARRQQDADAREVAARIALAEAVGVSPASLEGVNFAWEGFDAALTATNVDAVRDNALLARVDVLRALAAYDQAEADLRAEVGKQWPEIHVGPGYTWERGLVKLPFSVGLVLPPADLNRGAIAAAEARRSEAGVHVEAVIARTQAAVDGALIERKAALAALAHIRDLEIPAAQRIAGQADEELANGAIDRVDWCAAQVSLLLMRLAEVDALRRMHVASAALEDALRRPLDGPELQIAPQAVETP